MREVIDQVFRRTRALLCFLLLMPAGLAPALAQDGDADPQFLIERIVVEGIQRDSARAIVASETRLREGQPYSEPALREAIYRVKRLPFVLDAEFSLRKGSERGAYELVITVEPTRPVFFLAQTDGYVLKPEDRFGRGAIQTYSYGSIGARQFLGAKGLLFASIDKREHSAPSYQLGYTHYNPLGPGSYATVGGYWLRGDEGALDRRSSNLSLELGVPMAANQSLRGSLSWGQDDYDFDVDAPFGSSEQDADVWSGALEWIHDTRDDPLFPSQGDRLTASAGYSQTDVRSRFQAQIFQGEIETFEARFHQEDLYTAADAFRYFRLTGRQSASLGALAFYQTTQTTGGFDRPDRRRRNWDAAATAGHSVNLWGYEKTDRIGDLRFESQLTVGYGHSSSAGFSGSQTAARLSTGLVFRNAWGVMRATLSYTEEEL